MKKKLKDFIIYIRILLFRFIAVRRAKKIMYGEKILIVAPHPDDEVIGCSGLIQRMKKEGKEIFIVILSGGEASHCSCCEIDKDRLINARYELTLQAAQLLKLPIDRIYRLSYPDGKISKEHSETERFRSIINSICPDTVVIPHWSEGCVDHRHTHEITRFLLKDELEIELYAYCVWFWYYYNIWNISWKNMRLLNMSTDEYQTKLQAINIYITPKAPCGKPYSGVLPKMLLKAGCWNRELFFRIK